MVPVRVSPTVSSDESVEAVDEELLFFMKLIDETDGDVDGDVDESSASRSTTRRSLGTRDPDWQHFYQKARDGNVKATVVIDFEYEFNNTVERMYCFEDGDTSRVVIHVHTLEVWPGYATANDPATDPTTRARKVRYVIELGEQLLQQAGNFYVSASPRESSGLMRGAAGSMPVRYKWPDAHNGGARRGPSPAPAPAPAPAPPPVAPYSLQETMAAGILAVGSTVLLQQRPNRRQWGLAAVAAAGAAAVAACAWAVWRARAVWCARSQRQVSGRDAAARSDVGSDEREREAGGSRAQGKPLMTSAGPLRTPAMSGAAVG
ncbi:hypothetical protein T484DRAFT_1780329 [Baffinella frigidus]|nr:hypothetical protein T484DRAFT_1780329 [Cryptophyta sp. CCMP2293]